VLVDHGGRRRDRDAAELGLADQSKSVAKNAVEHSSAMSITP
jgi:hypothetical protein